MEKEITGRSRKWTSVVLLLIGGILIAGTEKCSHNASVAESNDTVALEALMQLDTGNIPVETFFKNPAQSSFCISPDGNYISYLGPYQSRLNIFIQKLNTSEPPVRVTSETDRDISSYFWKNNSTLLYIKDSGGDENYQLYAINKDGTGQRDLTPEKNVRIEVIDELRNFPEEVIIAMNKNNPALFEPYRLNIKTGQRQQLAENKDMSNPVTDWKVDNNGQLRMAVSVEKGTKTHLLYRDKESDPFTSILMSDWKDMVEPLFFDENNTFIYALSNLNRDKAALVKIDPHHPESPEIVLENPHVDIMYADRSPKKHQLISAYYATDKKHFVFFDDQLRAVYEKLCAEFPGQDIYFNSFDDSENKIIVRTFSDLTPGSFYLYNSVDGTTTHLADINPDIPNNAMSNMEAVEFLSRDSLTIHGYITYPKGTNKKNLPAVVLVHGGPMSRDYWGYRADVQLLASRGYAVLQINFRGSWGYGKNFAVAGFREWGKKMQDDISDGVQWMTEKGIADKNRIAIYGASYGGYAALAGVAFTPNLYACAIDYVGPSNLFTLLNNLPSYWEPEKEMMYEMIGHPQKDSLLLFNASPVFHADKIKVPLFIAQGANDPRVNKGESEQMVDVLRNNHIDVVYMLKSDEGHGFKLEENRLEFYKAMMGFLQKNMSKERSTP